LVLDPRSLWKLAVKLFQALLAGKSLILRQDMTLKIVEIERVKRDEKKKLVDKAKADKQRII
jgi:hypothetical protein